MPALLIYCYANGLFSSRRIERATHRDIGVRFVAANLRPDQDTIAVFRRANEAAFEAAFLLVRLLARECGLLPVGAVSIEGTKIDANASKIRSVRYDRAQARARVGQARESAHGHPHGEVLAFHIGRGHTRRIGTAFHSLQASLETIGSQLNPVGQPARHILHEGMRITRIAPAEEVGHDQLGVCARPPSTGQMRSPCRGRFDVVDFGGLHGTMAASILTETPP